MLERVMLALTSQPGVDDWHVRQVQSESTQYYLARTKPENRRFAQVQRLEVEVYSDHPSPGGEPSRGSATVTFVPGDEPRTGERIAEAVSMAGLTSNPPYGLPGPAVYPSVLIADRRLEVEPERVTEQLAEELLGAVESEPGISLASAEFFVDGQSVRLRNSRGIDAQQQGTSLFVDLVLLARDDASGRETEAHVEVRRRSADSLDLAGLVRRQARYARDTLQAQEPATGRFGVIVSGEALRDLLQGMFLSPLAFRASAQFKYQHLSPWEVGQSIFGDIVADGDPFTFCGNALLPWGTESAPFDREGLAGQRLLIVENGVLRNLWASQRYAEYLQVPPTGAFGNLEVLPGSMPVADMWAGDNVIYHIVAFSSMSPDPVTGNYVGEIRLGYERRGNELRPVKGGSVSGNLFADLARARLSQEMVFLGDYLGPEAVRLREVTISGA